MATGSIAAIQIGPMPSCLAKARQPGTPQLPRALLFAERGSVYTREATLFGGPMMDTCGEGDGRCAGLVLESEDQSISAVACNGCDGQRQPA